MDRMSEAGLAAMAINAEHGDRRAADDLYAEARRALAADLAAARALLASRDAEIARLVTALERHMFKRGEYSPCCDNRGHSSTCPDIALLQQHGWTSRDATDD